MEDDYFWVTTRSGKIRLFLCDGGIFLGIIRYIYIFAISSTFIQTSKNVKRTWVL